MSHDPAHLDSGPHDTIVAVFDSKMMALRAQADLTAADYDDIWLGVVRGENDAGRTTVARDGEPEIALHVLLEERGARDLDVHRFDGILPPGTAVMSLRVRTKLDQAIDLIEMVGGHIDHL